jgi:hypothetical protein
LLISNLYFSSGLFLIRIHYKLKTIIWDRNGTTFQGFEDIAEALEKYLLCNFKLFVEIA